MATNQVATVPKKGFMDYPPETRNQMYETLISDTWDSPVITSDRINCTSIFDLVLSLGLQKRFPLLATSTQIMHEAFAFCVEKCTLRLEKLDQLNAIHAVKDTPVFQHFAANTHSVTLDISLYGHGIDDPRDYRFADMDQTKIRSLIPLSMLHLRCRCHGPDPSKFHSFADLIAELALLFPSISSLNIDLDKTTLGLHRIFKEDILALPWPSLREVKFQRPDLERQFAQATEQMVLFGRHNRHQAAVWPPRAVPWQLEMDCRFMESVNESTERDMRRKIKKGGADARHPLKGGPMVF
ncbi:hypothetical protein Q7P35_010495 [Cladosporium inversicolor]